MRLRLFFIVIVTHTHDFSPASARPQFKMLTGTGFVSNTQFLICEMPQHRMQTCQPMTIKTQNARRFNLAVLRALHFLMPITSMAVDRIRGSKQNASLGTTCSPPQ
jgi:hypothetical protein